MRPLLVTSDPRLGVELPRDHPRDPLRDAEPLIQRGREAAREREPVGPDPNLVDPDDERLAAARAPHFEGPDEGVPVVELRIARLEKPPVGAVQVNRLEAPARIQRRERDRVAGVDGEDGLELGREVPVERAPLERHLVDHRAGSPGYCRWASPG